MTRIDNPRGCGPDEDNPIHNPTTILMLAHGDPNCNDPSIVLLGLLLSTSTTIHSPTAILMVPHGGAVLTNPRGCGPDEDNASHNPIDLALGKDFAVDRPGFGSRRASNPSNFGRLGLYILVLIGIPALIKRRAWIVVSSTA